MIAQLFLVIAEQETAGGHDVQCPEGYSGQNASQRDIQIYACRAEDIRHFLIIVHGSDVFDVFKPYIDIVCKKKCFPVG